ncbi:eukaryotic translation initiation factor 4E [Sporobolomyces koalae]|uniref:eukaryotic translation initiation factor 4E n=1 Tax=Sporobolomyces koalae TaxID=500713 RepID=UPI003174E1D6
MSTDLENTKKEEQLLNGETEQQQQQQQAETSAQDASEGAENKADKGEAQVSGTDSDAAEPAAKDDALVENADKEAGDAASANGAVTSDDAPLTKMLEQLDQLSEKEQQVIKENLERISEYPKELPLSQSWTLHFSDTSGASKHSSAAATKDAYTEGINPVFVATTVPGLCGQLKAFKKAVRHKRAKPNEPDGLGLNRPGMNLHFFRTGISPTWEDPYNEKGGRLTISPPAALFDPIYERLVLLLAGSSLELATSDLLTNEGPSPVSKRPPTPGPPQEGLIMGVVASRRARGDRIELWVGGKEKREPTPGDWIDRLKEVLAEQLEMPELRTSKYKKHF